LKEKYRNVSTNPPDHQFLQDFQSQNGVSLELDEEYELKAKSIVFLRIFGNKYQTPILIPHSINLLNRLQEFWLMNCDLKNSSIELANLPNIQTLRIDNCHATSFSIRNMPNLKYLFVGKNELAQLPSNMEDFDGLISLQFGDNKIQMIPESLKGFHNLEFLDLSGNPLEEIPEWIGTLVNLKNINLSNLQMTTFPRWIKNLTKTNMINLSNNQLELIPDWFCELENVFSDIDLSNNKIPEIPGGFSKLTMKNLRLSGNPLNVLPSDMKKMNLLTYLDISDTNIMQNSFENREIIQFLLKRNCTIKFAKNEQENRKIKGKVLKL
jgi:Leucine-rich repeat (LRR) protein